MKTILSAIAALVIVATAFSATSVRSKEAHAAKADFEKHAEERHKWKKGEAFPQSFAGAGLLFDATLVWSDSYLDGGTRGYLFRDIAGNFFAICTGPGLQSKDLPNRIDAPVGSRLFIGGVHYTKDSVQMVPAGSKSEAWLRKLIGE